MSGSINWGTMLRDPPTRSRSGFTAVPSTERRATALRPAPAVAQPAPHQPTPKKRIVFLYLGRRGGIARLAYELAVAATEHDQIDPLLVISESNELRGRAQALPGVARCVKTFSSSLGALTLHRIPSLIQDLNSAFDDHHAQAVVVLASHVWSPLIGPFLKTADRRYVVVVHDAAHSPTAAAFSRLPAMESSSNTSRVGVGVTTMNIW